MSRYATYEVFRVPAADGRMVVAVERQPQSPGITRFLTMKCESAVDSQSVTGMRYYVQNKLVTMTPDYAFEKSVIVLFWDCKR